MCVQGTQEWVSSHHLRFLLCHAALEGRHKWIISATTRGGGGRRREGRGGWAEIQHSPTQSDPTQQLQGVGDTLDVLELDKPKPPVSVCLLEPWDVHLRQRPSL